MIGDPAESVAHTEDTHLDDEDEQARAVMAERGVSLEALDQTLPPPEEVSPWKKDEDPSNSFDMMPLEYPDEQSSAVSNDAVGAVLAAGQGDVASPSTGDSLDECPPGNPSERLTSSPQTAEESHLLEKTQTVKPKDVNLASQPIMLPDQTETASHQAWLWDTAVRQSHHSRSTGKGRGSEPLCRYERTKDGFNRIAL